MAKKSLMIKSLPNWLSNPNPNLKQRSIMIDETSVLLKIRY